MNTACPTQLHCGQQPSQQHPPFVRHCLLLNDFRIISVVRVPDMVEIQGPPVPGEFGQESQPPPRPLYTDQIPPELRASTSRLSFPPSYVVVGVYRLLSDKTLYVPAWKKCQHGFVRGATVGLVWVSPSQYIILWKLLTYAGLLRPLRLSKSNANSSSCF